MCLKANLFEGQCVRKDDENVKHSMILALITLTLMPLTYFTGCSSEKSIAPQQTDEINQQTLKRADAFRRKAAEKSDRQR
jgi:hypothetical protein